MSRGGPPMPLAAHLQQARGAIGELERRAPGESLTFRCSSCGVEPVGPRPGACRSCVRRESGIRKEVELQERALIPPRFRWARLDLAHFAPPGMSRPVVHPEAIRRVRSFRGQLLVIRGETGRGKTSLACARLLQEAEHGRSAAYVPCEDISPDATDQDRAHALLGLARSCAAVILDDVGSDLGGAPVGSPLAAYRGDRLRRLIRSLYNATGIDTRPRLVMVTLGLEDEALRAYGEDVVRRLVDESPGTMILRLGGRP